MPLFVQPTPSLIVLKWSGTFTITAATATENIARDGSSFNPAGYSAAERAAFGYPWGSLPAGYRAQLIDLRYTLFRNASGTAGGTVTFRLRKNDAVNMNSDAAFAVTPFPNGPHVATIVTADAFLAATDNVALQIMSNNDSATSGSAFFGATGTFRVVAG